MSEILYEYLISQSAFWTIDALSNLVVKLFGFQEIDYSKEAANAELFANNFKDLDYVKVPKIYWEFTTPQAIQYTNYCYIELSVIV